MKHPTRLLATIAVLGLFLGVACSAPTPAQPPSDHDAQPHLLFAAAPVAGPTISTSTATVAPGGTVTASWSGIASPAPTDWIAMYPPNPANNGAYLDWKYVSCSRTAGAAKADGSCDFTVPSTAPSPIVFVLFARNTYSRLATSSPVTIAVPNSTVVPTAVPTGASTAVPTSTPPPEAVEEIEGVPLCPDHDATTWHPLVKRDSAGTILCTYGHEHHADPHLTDDIFGPPGAWWADASHPAQEISYPWQTSSAAGPENVAKHPGYKWHSERDLACQPQYPNGGCIIAYRIEAHSMGTASDAVVRFHSYSFEALVEYQGVQAIVRHGGHFDAGFLGLIVDDGNTVVCPPLAVNPARFACRDSGNLREASGANVPDPHIEHDAFNVNWYASHKITTMTIRLEEFGPVDYQNPAHQLFHADAPAYDPTRQRNNSAGRVGNIIANLAGVEFAPFTHDAYVDFDGYTDRGGTMVQGCATPSVDCVRLRVEHARAAAYAGWPAVRVPPSTGQFDYDEYSPVTRRSLIRFPN